MRGPCGRYPGRPRLRADGRPVRPSAWLTFLAAICYFLVYVGLEVHLLACRDGQTLGKGLMDLRVVPADTGSELHVPLVVGQDAVRMLLIFLPFVLAAAAGGAPGDRLLDALASIGFLALLTIVVLAACPPAASRPCTISSAGHASSEPRSAASSGRRTTA